MIKGVLSDYEKQKTEEHKQRMLRSLPTGSIIFKGAQEVIEYPEFPTWFTPDEKLAHYFAFPDEEPHLERPYILNMYMVMEPIFFAELHQLVGYGCDDYDEAMAQMSDEIMKTSYDGGINPVYVSDTSFGLDHFVSEILLVRNPEKLIFIGMKMFGPDEFITGEQVYE